VNLLLAALESGEVRLEREGLSMRAPASFRLIGSYDPAEGTPRKHLLDRVGLLVVLPPMVGVRIEAAADGSGDGDVVVVTPVFLEASDLAGPEHDVHMMITASSSTPSTSARRRQ
jgi:hypothetical protein